MKKLFFLFLLIGNVGFAQDKTESEKPKIHKIIYYVDTVSKCAELTVLDKNNKPIKNFYPFDVGIKVWFKPDDTISKQTGITVKVDSRTKNGVYEAGYGFAEGILNEGWKVDRIYTIDYLYDKNKKTLKGADIFSECEFEIVYRKKTIQSSSEERPKIYKIIYYADTINKHAQLSVLDRDGNPVKNFYPSKIGIKVWLKSGDSDSKACIIKVKTDSWKKGDIYDAGYDFAEGYLNKGWNVDQVSTIEYSIEQDNKMLNRSYIFSECVFEIVFKKMK